MCKICKTVVVLNLYEEGDFITFILAKFAYLQKRYNKLCWLKEIKIKTNYRHQGRTGCFGCIFLSV